MSYAEAAGSQEPSEPLSRQPVRSMTGFAVHRVDVEDWGSFTLSLKSVNHRFLDLQLRLPHGLDTLEAAIRKQLKDQLHRGHVELTLQLDRHTRGGIAFNDDQIEAYLAAFRSIATKHGVSSEPDLNEILRLPGVMSNHQSHARDDSRGLEAAVLLEMPNLISQFNGVRAQEGDALAAELGASMRRLGALAAEVSGLREGARAAAFEHLRSRIAELTGAAGPSDDRLLAEAALLVDRSDVEEELVRLRAHAGSFIALLDQGGAVGKRLDFLLQELNREANTLLSKTGGASSQNGLRVTEIGLDMKMEIERAREQIQNLE